MVRFDVLIKTIEDAKDFCNIATHYDYNILVNSGKFTIDAKSILGLFSLDLRNKVHVTCETEDASDFMRNLGSMVV